MKKYLYIILSFLMVFNPFVSYAAMPVNPGYVSQTGSGSACTSGSPCAMSYANTNADDDDVVILKDDGGTFTTGINPTNSGSSGHPITFQNEAGADVIIDESSTSGINIPSKSYIIVRANPSGGTLTINPTTVFWLNEDSSSAHILIDGLNFTGSGTAGYRGLDIAGQDTVVKNCTLTTTGDPDDLIWVQGNHHVIKNNTLGDCSHMGINLRGVIYIVIKGNELENNRHTNFGGDRGRYVLIEDNISRNAGTDCALNDCVASNPYGSSEDQARPSWNHSILQTNWDNFIIRGNLFYSDGTHSWVGIAAYSSSGYEGSDVGRIYNNTLADMCLNLWTYYSVGYSQTDNKYINNIFLNGGTACSSGYNYLFRAGFYDTTNKTYNNTISGTGSVTPSISTLNSTYGSDNITTDPLLDANYRPQSTSISIIDAAMEHTLTNGTGAASTTMVVDDGPMFFSKEAWGYTSGMYSYSEIESDYIYVNAATPFTVQITNVSGNTLTLASAQTWQDGVEVWWLKDGTAFSGSAPDVGAYEYDSGTPQPPTPDPIQYLLADLTDENTNYDLTCIGGSCDFSTNAGSLTVDDAADGVGSVDISTDWNIPQFTVIVNFTLSSSQGSYTQPLVDRWDYGNDGRSWLFSLNTSGQLQAEIGYNSGASVELYNHATVLSNSTEYWAAMTFDYTNKLLSIYLFNSSGTTVGSDIEDTAILSGRTGTYNESNLLIGGMLDSGSKATNQVANAIIHEVYMVPNTILPKTDIVNYITGAGDATPTISSNCWLDADRSACLTENRMVYSVGELVCHRFTGSEDIYSQGGLGVFAQQVTASATNAKTLTYYSGYSGAYIDLCYTSAVGDRFGFLDISATNSLSDGTDTIVDVENNAFDLTVSATHTYRPWFDADAKSPKKGSTSAASIDGSLSGQPMK